MLNINLKGKTALVTGISSGIGMGVAKMLAHAGCNISGCGKSQEDSKEVKSLLQEINSHKVLVHYSCLDITDTDNQQLFLNKTKEIFGTIDILVSNAGVNVFEGAEKCSDERWEYNMNLNLKTHWKLAQLCKPYLEHSNNGTIIIMTSNHSNHTIPGCFPYNVAKTGLKGLIQSLAIEWGPNIRTIGIAPGFIDTAGNKKWFDSFDNPNEERQRTIGMHPVKRLGQPEEIGAFCAFLCSDYAKFITGTTYLIDGGRSAIMQYQ